MSTLPFNGRRTTSVRRRRLTLSLLVISFAVFSLTLIPTLWRGHAQVGPSAPLTAGNIVVYRVGTGAAALHANATAVFLDEYTPAGSLVQSIAMPTTDSGGNQTLTASGTATSEGLLTLSADGQYLVLTGYDAALGTASITTSTSCRRSARVLIAPRTRRDR